MKNNNIKKYFAVICAAAGLTAVSAMTALANTDVGKSASRKYHYQSMQGPGAGAGAGELTGEEAPSLAGPDTEAPVRTDAYGYTEDDARALCEYVYSYETNPVKKEIGISYLMNSIWYDPSNMFRADNGQSLLKLYEGPRANYNRAYLEALDGLEFFATPTVMFLETDEGNVIVAVQTGSRFTEEQAAVNYNVLRTLVPVIEEVKAAVAGKDSMDCAKYICDYVAARLEYDRSFEKNSLADALVYGQTACVGYNALTELLFEHCGIPYVSIVAKEVDNQDSSHIFGMGRIGNSWLVFDTTNYDRENGNEPFWIFSDKYREGMYYNHFEMVETVEGFEV